MAVSEEGRLRQQAGAYRSWANTSDRTARTAKAREASRARFLEQAGGDELRAAALERAHLLEMAAKSLEVRRLKKRVLELEDELEEGGGGDAA